MKLHRHFPPELASGACRDFAQYQNRLVIQNGCAKGGGGLRASL